MKHPQFLHHYHPLHSHITSIVSSTCPMDRQHFRKAQHKAEAALLVSMRQWQQRLGTTPTGLPSSSELWRSLRLQLMVTLQRFASERKLMLLEAKNMILRTNPQDLLMEERCWLESARNLVSIMPPLTVAEVKSYNLSSYPPKLIPHPETSAVPSMSTSSIRPSTSIPCQHQRITSIQLRFRPQLLRVSFSHQYAISFM